MSSKSVNQIRLPARTARVLDDGRLDLGELSSFPRFPARFEIEGVSYFLTRDDAGTHHLLSSVCPHLGSEIADLGDVFECPNHGWRFDWQTGRCHTAPTERMASTAVDVIDGRLIARPVATGTRANGTKPVIRKTVTDLTISLHAHACLEFRRRGFSLITDPWLVGPAFLGAWTHYPPSPVDVDSLKPDVIWISHEHSDHFHEPTLKRFDRATPIYLPDFPNRRMVTRLYELGFTQVVAMPFGGSFNIGGGMTLTCFEPGSLWNDAVVLIDIDGFRFLNLNDAGLNRRIAASVAPVDVIASSFTPGASGYPLTWTHLDDQQKQGIIERARAGILRMLKEAVAMYGGTGGAHVIPYAGHFALWHPSHAKYVRAMHKNTLDDVVRAFEGEAAGVVDLMPGEAWNVTEDKINRRWKRRERLYEPEHLLGYVGRAFDPETFAEHHPRETELSREEIEAYFLKLNDSREISFCEEMAVTVRVTDKIFAPVQPDIGFEVAGGAVRILEEPVGNPNLLIEIPRSVLAQVIRETLSWDEAHIGHWCRFLRNPDVFHAGFWRLLQAPYFARSAKLSANAAGELVDANWVIADVIEKLGPEAERIIGRYGLYCVGCQHSTAETLAHGAAKHGIDNVRLDRMICELNFGRNASFDAAALAA
ncbi:MAG TPA: Rieske 2Fe-2S domain-containing protein [Tepidisphaeraceae bacterium]|nr:Rieske 2Fe-2S domain-containing protein [Tepidisphaeraceae bacterium]